MEFKSKIKKEKINDQSIELVGRIEEFMRKEASAPPTRLSKVGQRIVEATGLSIRTIRRIDKERKDINRGLQSGFIPPLQNRSYAKPKTGINEDERRLLRTIMLNFYITHKKVPYVKQIHKEFVEATGYVGSESSVYRLLGEMGFYWRKTKSTVKSQRRILMERADIKLQRINYLRSIKVYREKDRQIVFMDEAYLNPQQASEKSWSGQRLIIVHAFCNTGCIPNACLIFQSKSKSGDYYNDMDYENYKRWLTKKFIPNLPANSVVVMGSAPYHSLQLEEECPNYSSKKEIMIQWLQSRNVMCDINMYKVELYNLVKLYKPQLKVFQIDKLFIENGHNVLRIPPNHPDLNPNELVWTSLKQHVSQSYVTYELREVINLADNYLRNFSAEDWTARYRLVEDIENEYLRKEIALDAVIDQLIADFGINEDTDDDEDHDEEYDDEADSELNELEQDHKATS